MSDPEPVALREAAESMVDHMDGKHDTDGSICTVRDHLPPLRAALSPGPEPVAEHALRAVDEAWEALMSEFYGTGIVRRHIATHRPLIEAALRAALSPGPEPVALEYDRCEMTHAKGTTHYHPLRVSERIKEWEAAHSPGPKPVADVKCLTCGAPVIDAMAGSCHECGATDGHIGTQWLRMPLDQRPLFGPEPVADHRESCLTIGWPGQHHGCECECHAGPEPVALEYDRCEMTHAKGTTHYHPLRVSKRIKEWEAARSPGKKP